MSKLWKFAGLVLQLVPVQLWWCGAGAAFCVLNLILQQEVWPNTPKAPKVFQLAGSVMLLLIPWLVTQTLRRVSRTLVGSWWYWPWGLLSMFSFFAAILASAIALIWIVLVTIEILGG